MKVPLDCVLVTRNKLAFKFWQLSLALKASSTILRNSLIGIRVWGYALCFPIHRYIYSSLCIIYITTDAIIYLQSQKNIITMYCGELYLCLSVCIRLYLHFTLQRVRTLYILELVNTCHPCAVLRVIHSPVLP